MQFRVRVWNYGATVYRIEIQALSPRSQRRTPEILQSNIMPTISSEAALASAKLATPQKPVQRLLGRRWFQGSGLRLPGFHELHFGSGVILLMI